MAVNIYARVATIQATAIKVFRPVRILSGSFLLPMLSSDSWSSANVPCGTCILLRRRIYTPTLNVLQVNFVKNLVWSWTLSKVLLNCCLRMTGSFVNKIGS
jgi:hypothetical protein